MGRYARGVRDGSGPYYGSYQRSRRRVGKRMAAGIQCPTTSVKDIKPIGKTKTTLMGMKSSGLGTSKVGLSRRVKLTGKQRGLASMKDIGWKPL